MRPNPIQSALLMLDRQGQRMYLRQYEKDRMRRPEAFVPQKMEPDMTEAGLLAAWVHREWMVQLWQKPDSPLRLSINRTRITASGAWVDGITWDELQMVKNSVGFADKQCVEMYPPTGDVVNVANLRHLWVMDPPLPFTL